MIQGRQQQTATPITQASAAQKTTKNTSNARNTMHSLIKERTDKCQYGVTKNQEDTSSNKY
jgi:hypothetical protein